MHMLAAVFFASPPGRGNIHAMTAVMSVEDFSREAAPLRPLLRAVAASVLRSAPDHPDVDDAVSETMRRAIEGRARIRAGEPLRGWMIGIAKHVALDAARSRTRALKRRPSDASPESTRDITDRIPDSKPSPFDRAARTQEITQLESALRELPDKQREVIVLFFIEGLSYVEIGQKLGVPMGTVATWILRGRRSLAAALAERRD
jgi:RNA polymerase sigma factor (sigma-70 family)